MLQAVVFDLDDTLIDWSQHDDDWMELRRKQLAPVCSILERQGHSEVDLEAFAQAYNDTMHNAWISTCAPEWLAPRQIDALRESLKVLSIELNDDELHGLQRKFDWGPMPSVTVFPGTVELLETLRRHGLHTGLLTNASSPIWMRDRELEAFGLIHLLDVRYTAGDIGHLKPHPRAFTTVLEGIGVQPDEAVFVGDRPRDDIGGAQSVGMRGVLVKRREDEMMNGIQPDATIHHLPELISVLDEWYPGWR